MGAQTKGNTQKNGKKKLTKKQRRKRKIILFIIEAVVVLILLAGVYIWQKLQKVEHEDPLEEEQVSINKMDKKTKEILEDYTNIAIFGLDNRDTGTYASGNSDCIMIASINNDTKEVKLVSVYRDTYLAVDEEESSAGSFLYRKVNSAYGRGGAKNAVKALNRNLDLDIVQYISVDFKALTNVIDALGGIELDITSAEAANMNGQNANAFEDYIEENMKVTGKTSSHVSAGLQTVDGVQATAYCRIRSTAGDDFKRTERQRTVISKMIEKAKKADILTLNRIVDEVLGDVSTSLTSMQILDYAKSLMEYELVDTHGFPFELATGSYGSKGDLVVAADLEQNVKQLHEYLFGTADYEPSNTVVKISEKVKNETGVTAESATRIDNPLDDDDSVSSELPTEGDSTSN